jgi:hypothetical protein
MVRIFPTRPVFPIHLLLGGCCCLFVAACSDNDQIRSYTIEPVIQPDSTEPPERLEAAQQPQAAWFFKLLGPAEAVSNHAAEFDALLRTVRLTSGRATWDTPAGWTEQAGGGIRFATLVIPDTEAPLEISVTTFPAPDPGADAYLLQNINRWRGQVGLAPYTQADWRSRGEAAGGLADLSEDDLGVLRVDFAGSTEEIPEARMLAAVVWQSGGRSAAVPSQPMAASGSLPFTYDAPAEWHESSPRTFQLALFTIGEGDNRAEVSVSNAAGDLELNINRWRSQVGLPPLAGDGLADAYEAIQVDGRPAVHVDMKGAEKSIVAVVVPEGQSKWFFKLIGPTDLVERESERFDAFVQSVEFSE